MEVWVDDLSTEDRKDFFEALGNKKFPTPHLAKVLKGVGMPVGVDAFRRYRADYLERIDTLG